MVRDGRDRYRMHTFLLTLTGIQEVQKLHFIQINETLTSFEYATPFARAFLLLTSVTRGPGMQYNSLSALTLACPTAFVAAQRSPTYTTLHKDLSEQNLLYSPDRIVICCVASH